VWPLFIAKRTPLGMWRGVFVAEGFAVKLRQVFLPVKCSIFSGTQGGKKLSRIRPLREIVPG
jgi:hypothetical protein